MSCSSTAHYIGSAMHCHRRIVFSVIWATFSGTRQLAGRIHEDLSRLRGGNRRNNEQPVDACGKPLATNYLALACFVPDWSWCGLCSDQLDLGYGSHITARLDI